MGNILGKERPLKEVLRENKRMINRAVRELDREKTGLEREEKRLTMEIKKAAKEGQMGAVKIMAKVSKQNAVWCSVVVCVVQIGMTPQYATIDCGEAADSLCAVVLKRGLFHRGIYFGH